MKASTEKQIVQVELAEQKMTMSERELTRQREIEVLTKEGIEVLQGKLSTSPVNFNSEIDFLASDFRLVREEKVLLQKYEIMVVYLSRSVVEQIHELIATASSRGVMEEVFFFCAFTLGVAQRLINHDSVYAASEDALNSVKDTIKEQLRNISKMDDLMEIGFLVDNLVSQAWTFSWPEPKNPAFREPKMERTWLEDDFVTLAKFVLPCMDNREIIMRSKAASS